MNGVIDRLNPGDVGQLTASALVGARSASRASTAAGHDERIPRMFLVAADFATVALAFLAAHVLAPWVQWVLLPSGPLGLSLPAWLSLPDSANLVPFPPLNTVSWVLMVTAPTTLVVMDLMGGYKQLVDQSRTRVVLTSMLAPLIAVGFVALALFAVKASSSSRVFFFTFSMATVLGLVTYRSAVRFYKNRRLAAGAYAKNVVLIAPPEAVDWLARHFRDHVQVNRFRLAGWLSTMPAARAGASPTGLSDLGSVDDLSTLLVHTPIHEVIAVQSSDAGDWLGGVIEGCDYFRVRLRIVPEALLFSRLHDLALMFRTDPLKLPAIVLAPPHLDSDALFVKRFIDIAVSAVLLLLLAPLFLVIAAAIKISTPRLPVFYPWHVIGLKGRAFTGYKFTTMKLDADLKRSELLSFNEMDGPVFKVRNDPRVTRLGWLLRKYSLNELPQLWSVLKGDMSLVGPRPAFRHELERYELWHKRKLCVKPGMTCLWQVSGRNRIHRFDDWVQLDLEYIDNWSLGLDFRILVRTVWAVVAGTGS